MRLFASTKLHTIFKMGCLFMACYLTPLLLSSCSSEEDIRQPETTSHAVTISFNLRIHTEDDTRSGRQIWSRTPRQQVNDMKVYVFKGSDLAATYVTSVPVAEFINSYPNSTETHSVTFTADLEEGTYSFLAVGFESDIKDGTVLPNETYHLENDVDGVWTPQITPGLSTLEEMNIVLNAGKNVDEVFAGIKQGIMINADSKVVKGGSIILNRIPAGLLGYFENIPYQLPTSEGDMERVTRLAVVASVKGYRARLLPPFNAMEMGTGNYELLSFDLSSLSVDTDHNRYSIPAYDWRAEGLEEAPKGVRKINNSVLGGCFLLPAHASKNPTLQVVLYGGETGEKVLKTYDVVCADHILNDNTSENAAKQDNRRFDIIANHYYSLGVKYTDSGEDPDDDPPQPFKPDDPIDLSKEQIITINVSPGWDQRHDMTL